MVAKPEDNAGPAARELGQPEARDADVSEAARKSVEGDGGGKEPAPGGIPAAGPHADPKLQNPDATPGAGALPSGDRQGDEAESASG